MAELGKGGKKRHILHKYLLTCFRPNKVHLEDMVKDGGRELSEMPADDMRWRSVHVFLDSAQWLLCNVVVEFIC